MEMVKLTIDGIQVEVPKGTTVLKQPGPLIFRYLPYVT